MEEYPGARDEEFKHTASFIKAAPGTTILDVPAGGAYLQRFLPDHIDYLPYDFAGAFEDNHSPVKKCSESAIELEDNSIDEVVTLAALHHIVDRSAFYSEVHRVLRSKGRFIIADVVIDSKVDTFLNGFLDKWNSMGHKGRFLDPEVDLKALEAQGFSVSFHHRTFTWNFSSESDAHTFFRKLFYLDLEPTQSQLSEALEGLGLNAGKGFSVNWELGFLIGTKNSH